MQERTTAIQSI